MRRADGMRNLSRRSSSELSACRARRMLGRAHRWSRLMARAGFRLRRAVALACLMVGAVLARAAMATDSAPDDSTRAWAVILDPQQPLDVRQHTLAEREKKALDADQAELYRLGSLYQMGPRASGAPVARDLDKAALY